MFSIKIIFTEIGKLNWLKVYGEYDGVRVCGNCVARKPLNRDWSSKVCLLKTGKEMRVVEKYQERIDKLKQRFSGLLYFDYPKLEYLTDDIDMPNEDMYRQADLLRHADVLLTEYSTLVLEATFYDLPVVNISLYNFRNTDKPLAYFENYTHIRKLMDEKVMRTAYDYDQLFQHIKDYLSDRNLDSQNRQSMKRKFAHANPGDAATVIGRYLIDLAREKAG